MKSIDKIYFAKTARKTILLSLFCAAAGFVYAAEGTDAVQANDPIWTGSYSEVDKSDSDYILSAKKLNIASDSENNLVKDTIKIDEAKKASGGLDATSVDLTLKAVSEKKNATAFEAKSVVLTTEKSYKSSEIENPEDITLNVGTFKISAEAEAEKGTATAVKIGTLTNNNQRVLVTDDKTGSLVSEYESADATVEIAGSAKGLNATAVEIGTLAAGNATIEANAEATNGNAVGYKSTGYTLASEKLSLKASALAAGGNATAVDLGNISSNRDVEIEASATANQIVTEAADKSKSATFGNATAISSASEFTAIYGDSSKIKASTTANGGNATGLSAQYVTGKNIDFAIDATANTIEKTVSADGKTVTYAGGNATAIAADVIVSDSLDDKWGSSKKALEALSANVSATANAQGFDAKTQVSAKALQGKLTVGYNETKSIDIVKTLPEKLTNDVSANANFAANAGTAENGNVKYAGSATAFEGNITVGSEITVDNSYVVPNENAQKVTDKATLAPISIDSLAVAERLGKASLEGSFSANAVGGDAYGIKADKIQIGNRVILKQGDYKTTEGSAGKGVAMSAFDKDGKLVQKYGEVEKEIDGKKTKVWEAVKDANGNPVPVELVADKDGKYNVDVSDKAVQTFERELVGDFNANVSAESLGGNAVGIKANSIGANLNGNVSAVSNANVTYVLDKEGNATAATDAITVGNATAIDGGDMIGDINGNVSAISQGGNAVAIKANSINGEINSVVSAESDAVLAYKYVADEEDPTKQNLVVDQANSKFGTAVAVDPNTANMKLNSIVSAIAQQSVDNPNAAIAIDTTDGIVNLGDGAVANARVEVQNATDNTVFEHVTKSFDGAKFNSVAHNGVAINSATSDLTVNVDGRADLNGNVAGASTMNINGGNLVVAGDISATQVNIAEGANLTRTADAAGNIGKLDATVTHAAIARIEASELKDSEKGSAKNSYADSMRSSKISGNARMLVNDVKNVGTVTSLVKDEVFSSWDEKNVQTQMKKDDIATLVNQSGASVNFDYLTYEDNENVDVKVNSLSYFQDKAANANSARLGSSLDAITTLDELTQGKDEKDADYIARLEKREDEIQARRDFKSAVEASGFATAGYNGSIDLSNFMPVGQSYIAQVNADMLMNMNNVQMFRLSTIADAKRATKSTDNNATTNSSPNAAEFQSINMLGTQNGGSTAAGFDFYSAGGVAAFERDFSNSIFAGLSVGGVYNKVDGDNGVDANSTNFIVNLYGQYSMEQIPLDFFANIGYSHGWNETSRPSDLGTASSDYDSNSFYSLGGVAYTFSDVLTKGFSIKPMLMYNLAYSSSESAEEDGAGFNNAWMDSSDNINVRTMLGVEAKYDITNEFSAVARAFWSHEFADNSYDVDYRIAAGQNYMNNATYCGEELKRDAAVMGIGLQYKFSDRTSAFLDYSATLRDGYSSHGLNLGAQFKF